MDRETLLQQADRLESTRREKLEALRSAQAHPEGGAEAVRRSVRLRNEIGRAEDQIRLIRNALQTLSSIGADTTRYYVGKRPPGRS